MIKEIPIGQLKVGMYLVRYGRGTFDSPVAEPEKIVEDQSEINTLIQAGVEHVVVDLYRSKGGTSETGTTDESETPLNCVINKITLYEELAIARRIYKQALDYAAEFLDNIRHGEDFNYKKAEPIIQEVFTSLDRQEGAAAYLVTSQPKVEYLVSHSVNVGILAALYGRHLGLPEDKVLILAQAGLFHDIGKVRIDPEIMNKPGKLTPKEYSLVKTHPLEGYLLLKEKDDVPEEVLRAVLEHHERFDGSGYPRGLKGQEMSLYSRILSIVDVYDAITSETSYSQAQLPTQALRQMYQAKDSHFYPQYLEQFIKCMGIYPVGSLVKLSDGRLGVVIDMNAHAPLCPTVKVVFDHKVRPIHPEVVDLAESMDLAAPLSIVDGLDPAKLGIDLDLFMN